MKFSTIVFFLLAILSVIDCDSRQNYNHSTTHLKRVSYFPQTRRSGYPLKETINSLDAHSCGLWVSPENYRYTLNQNLVISYVYTAPTLAFRQSVEAPFSSRHKSIYSPEWFQVV